MASTTNGSSNKLKLENIPQWKKDLIQRRRHQTKVLANNGASVKLCTAVIGGSGGAETFDNGLTSVVSNQECVGATTSICASGGGGKSRSLTTTNDFNSVGVFAVQHSSVVGTTTSASASAADGGYDYLKPQHRVAPVAFNMRLETDVLCCSDTDYDLNTVNKMVDDNKTESIKNVVNNKLKISQSEMELCKFNNKPPSEDGESDSSEELQYGPGIVNRLKSKYLNLTLRDMNKTRANVQSFRRATSLEDLLDCDDDSMDKSQRKYTKRNNVTGVSVKNERYRNVSRGNDSIKRARSVETLLRYNSMSDDVTPHVVPSKFTTAGIMIHEPANDHIILIDRTAVKIESKLLDTDRPKAVNKPRRIKLVVDETERPPPDLVKTTMRLFEGSTKKLKPKGEVAAKVATFKTINDTFKAQCQKKIISKPCLQPKPFSNGMKIMPSSPKKLTAPSIPTVERLENPECLHNEGVITDPIVQSVSSVVSKFQQIEKSHSPSPSPEPFCKLKASSSSSSSPIPSPEPSMNKIKLSSPESKIKSPPSTPEPRPMPAPRISLSPLSPKKEFFRQNSDRESSINETAKTVNLSLKDSFEQKSEIPKSSADEKFESQDDQRKEVPRSSSPVQLSQDEREVVDGAKTISKLALENIAKAGTTMQFSFNNKNEGSNLKKNYLPGVTMSQNGQRTNDCSIGKIVGNKSDDSFDGNAISSNLAIKSQLIENVVNNIVSDQVPLDSLEITTNYEERIITTTTTTTTESTGNGNAKIIKSENDENSGEFVKVEIKSSQIESIKPIGAISSLGLMKSMNTSTSSMSYGQSNDTTKIMKTQKTEMPSPSPPQKQIGIIRPLVSTKTQIPQQNLSNREMEKNLINRVKSIEQPTKVVVSLKSSAEEIQPVKKTNNSGSGGGGGVSGGGGGLWDTKPWNDQNNTMVFNFSNRKEVPDYIENDGLRVRRKRAKPKAADGGIIVLDATLDASTTDDAEWEMTGGPPSPCNVSFLNDNILINGRSNLSKQPRNHKHRIQFDDTATRTFEYPSEASMLVGGDNSHHVVPVESSVDRNDSLRDQPENRPPSVSPTPPGIPSVLGGGGLASYTPSKVDLASEGFELGVTRASPSQTVLRVEQTETLGDVDYLKPAQDAGAWGSETTADLLF